LLGRSTGGEALLSRRGAGPGWSTGSWAGEDPGQGGAGAGTGLVGGGGVGPGRSTGVWLPGRQLEKWWPGGWTGGPGGGEI
jgi:hypothetical protein